MSFLLLISLVLAFICNAKPPSQFRFGNTQGDYMVLQQQPYRATIWGFSLPNDTITITLLYQSNSSIIETVTTNTNKRNSTWRTYLSPQPAKNDIEYIITATSKINSTNISISNILFGDVYFCSGQSNMGFTVFNAFNATEEIVAANNFPNIRVLKTHPGGSNTTQLEVAPYLPWSIANSTTIGGNNGTQKYFSAVCWFYGRDLYQHLNYPIGLMEGSNGGTPIRCFMAQEATVLCNETAANCDPNGGDKPDGYFWNGMIYPFLQTTIRGVLWYQGEEDSHEQCTEQYSCAMPAMINSWREYWHLNSDTNISFPFGLVQLAAWKCKTENVTCSSPSQNKTANCVGVGVIRWAQSANYGYLPNNIMPNSFMATAIDLGDPNSPDSDVHPRYKQEVGRRLYMAARNVIYGESNVYFNGPIAEEFTVDVNNKMGIISFANVGVMGLEIKNYYGFEFYDNGKWITQINTTFVINQNNDLLITLENNLVNTVEMIRFLWFHGTCYPNIGPYNCPIYDKQYQLPALPFIMNVTKNMVN